ncbi:hypothetical protein JBE38_23015 [Pseudomonas sp. ICBG1301]|uniref:hypothetical protein n=1 Tax=Pseudomonas sp. ICBG1301 TaxID=2795987 RepID=UPI00196390F2|nr:hypothetical protein [Pseudomonas sp. ICBG1301]MBM9488807.1 hypothetical protein [Pseudomonas sp. ICBG1301]
MIINIAHVWQGVSARHEGFLLVKLQKLSKFLSGFNGPSTTHHKLMEFLDIHKKAICQSDPLALPGVIAAFSQTFTCAVDVDYVKGLFGKYLCYENFIAKEKVVLLKKWDAYALCASTQLKVCPYCHIQPIDTYVSPDGLKSYRPNIDHYYPKAEFPFLALSIGNFIPCCEKCNGPQMKGATRFDLTPHLHPLVDAENITFRLIPKGQAIDPTALALQAKKTAYEIELVASNGTCQKVDNSVATFQLLARYQVCVPDALAVAKLSRQGSRKKILPELLPELDFDDDHPLGFDDSDDSYKNVLMGKLKLDIARQYGVI